MYYLKKFDLKNALQNWREIPQNLHSALGQELIRALGKVVFP